MQSDFEFKQVREVTVSNQVRSAFRRTGITKTPLRMKYSVIVGTLAIFVACGSGNDPSAAFTNVAVSFSTQSSAAASNSVIAPRMSASMSSFFLSDTLTDGQGNTLEITSVEIVLREIELERLDVVDCDVEPEPEGCEEFAAGPLLIDLPLTAGVQRQVALDIPPGIYTEVEFDIHKLSNSDPADAGILQANPGLVDKSIRVRGFFNGNPFEFTSDLNVEQELLLQPNLVISETDATATNLTIFIDVRGWFRDSAGNLIDPESGNKGGQNEGEVTNNIGNSIEAFEDANEDGAPT